MAEFVVAQLAARHWLLAKFVSSSAIETRDNFELFLSSTTPNDSPRKKSGVHPIYRMQAYL